MLATIFDCFLCEKSTCQLLPVDPRALYAQQYSKVDGSPERRTLPTVTAQFIAWEALYPLQQALPASPGPPVGPLPPIS